MTSGNSGDARPLVSIVTPSYNQGSYIAAAIDSVLAQDYPHIEYLVVDGGSTDDTLDVLASYDGCLKWTSEPDRGQAHAINKGLRQTRGDIVAWLNSDDAYAPGAVGKAVEAFASNDDLALVYGKGGILDESGALVGGFDDIEPFSLWRLVHCLDYILQPAAFFRRDAVLDAGLLDERLEFGLDWDLWIRLAAHGDVLFLDQQLGFSRVYGETKTSTGGWRRIRELQRIAERHAGRRWTPGVRLYAIDTLGTHLARHGGGTWKRAVRHLQASLSRRIVERLPVHADGWLGPRAKLLVPRRWNRARVVLEAHRLPSSGTIELRLEADGHRLARDQVTAPGELSLTVPLPPGKEPFLEIALSTDFSFQAPPDPRRLSLRCLGLEPCADRTASRSGASS